MMTPNEAAVLEALMQRLVTDIAIAQVVADNVDPLDLYTAGYTQGRMSVMNQLLTQLCESVVESMPVMPGERVQ